MPGCGIRRGSDRRAAALGLLFLALAARLLIPAGWMPAGDSRLGLIPCIGTGVLEARSSHHGNGHSGSPSPASSPDHPCAFAGVGTPMIAPHDVLITLPSLRPFEAKVFAAISEVAIGRGLAAPPPPSTGPPAHP